jgi:hypothetical protein
MYVFLILKYVGFGGGGGWGGWGGWEILVQVILR